MNWTKLFLFLISFLLTINICYAQDINLYDQPDTKAKIVGKLDTAAGIIPIFKPQTGEWVKVADPRNGSVGWIKQTDLNNVNESRSYQIIQYGKQNQMSDADMKEMVKRMQMHRESFQKSFMNMMNDMNKMFEEEWQYLKNSGPFPVMMPVNKQSNQPNNHTPAKQ